MSKKILNLRYKDCAKTFRSIVKKHFKPRYTTIERGTNEFAYFVPYVLKSKNGWEIHATVSNFVNFSELITPEGEEISIKGNSYSDNILPFFCFTPVEYLATCLLNDKREFLHELLSEIRQREFNEERFEIKATIDFLKEK